AVHGIGEESFTRVVPEHVEERLRLRLAELDLALFEPMQHLVLVVAAESGERTVAEGTTAVLVDLADRRAVDLRRRHLRLVALLLAALAPRPLHVPGLGAAVRTGELPVDEGADARFLAARAELVGRNQPR